MKKAKLLLVAITGAALGAALVGCGNKSEDHVHKYGSWSITTQPTLEAGGVASRNCEEGDDPQTYNLPALSDTSFWTKSGSASHAQGGSFTYTSAYGTVTVPVAAGEGDHVWGEWVIDVEPTETGKGSAHRSCDCGTPNDTAVLLELNDKSVWTKSGSPTHAEGGTYTYTSEYGTVTKTVAAGVVGTHEWGEWVIDEAYTGEEASTAHRSCACGASDDPLPIPALSDTSFWTKESETQADYFQGGETVYKNAANDITYTVTTEKVLAPYAYKTYFGVLFNYSGEYKNRSQSMEATWTNQYVALDKDGYTEEGASIFGYNAKPFQIQLVNAEGAIKTIATDSDGTKKETSGYMDMESGIFIVSRNDNWDYIIIGTPFETEATRNNCATSSCWTVGTDVAIAIQYTAPDETVYTYFIYNDNVYFGVSFVDGEGNAVAPEACYNAAQVYVKQGNDVIYSFGYDGEKMHALDGMEGIYTGTIEGIEGSFDMTVTGYGVLISHGMNGTYTLIEGNKYGALFTGNYEAYYEITINAENKTYTGTKPTAHVVYDLKNNDESLNAIDPEDKNINIPYNLPTPNVTETESAVFKGWYLDAACTQAAANPFTPTTADATVTLYAKWATKKHITVHAQYTPEDAEEKTDTIYVAVGDNVKALLDARYSLDLDDDNKVYFDGWFIDSQFQNALQDADTIPDNDTEIRIYAKWTAYNEFAGTYNGREIWAATTGGSSSATLKSITIDPRGNVSGDKGTGKFVSYDETTQYLVWETSSGTQRNFRYEKSTGILVANDGSGTKLSDDVWLMVVGCETGATPITAHRGINYRILDNGSFNGDISHRETRFITVTVKDGSTKNILLFNDKIYTSYKLTDADDNEISFADLNQYKGIMVYIGENNNELLFTAATDDGTNFADNSQLKQFDNYYGTYTAADSKTVRLNGIGGITYDGKTGTYTAAAGASYDFDVYLVDGTEYWRLTVNKTDMTATMDYPEVNVTFNSDHSTHTDVAGNKNVNIAFDLPTVQDVTGFVFRGWYTTPDFQGDPITSYTPDGSEANVIIYAKWIAQVTVTVHRDGAEPQVNTIGAGETFTIANEKRSDAKFLGWFTEAEGGTQFISGVTVVNESIDLHVHWGEPSIFMGTYSGIAEVSKTDYTTTSSKKLVVDADGVFVTGSDAAFIDGVIVDYDETIGRITWTKSDKTYYFWYYAEANLIITHDSLKATDASNGVGLKMGGDIHFLTKESMSVTAHLGISYKLDENGNFSSGTSQWSDYETRFIKLGDNDFLIFNSKIYTDYTVKDVADNTLATIAAMKASKSIIVFVDGEILFGAATTSTNFGTSSVSCKQLDAFYGVYTTTDSKTVTLDGIGGITYDGKTGTYTAAAEDAGYQFDVKLASNTESYRLTLNKTATPKTAEIVENKVTVTWTTEHGTAPAPQDVYANIAIASSKFPAAPEAEGWVFRHWSETPGGSKCNSFTPTKNQNMYAVWDPEVTLTFVFGNGYDEQTASYGAGDTITLLNPGEYYHNGQVFKGWFEDENFNTAVSFTKMPDTDKTLYAKWVESAPYEINPSATDSSSYKYAFVYDETLGCYKSTNQNVTGNSKSRMTVTAYAPGKLILNYLVSSETNSDKLEIYLNSSTSNRRLQISGYSDTTNGCASAYNASRFVEFSLELAANDVVYIIYAKGYSGDFGADTAWIRDIKLITFDASAAGTYTCEGQEDIVLDARANITRGGETGTYEKIGDNTYDVYFKQNGKNVSHYTIVLNKSEEGNTYTITPVTVDITFNMNGHGTAPEFSAFIGVVDLPMPTLGAVTEGDNHFLFDGWYTDEACTDGNEVTTVTPVANGTYSYYAKWVVAHTLTIKYGNGKADGVFTIASGETVDLNSYMPKFADKAFEGWYTDEEFNTSVEDTTFAITGDTIVYMKWGETLFVITTAGPTETSKTFTLIKETGRYETPAENLSQRTEYFIKIQCNAAGTLTITRGSTSTASDDQWYYTEANSTSTKYESWAYNASATKSFTVNEGDVIYIMYAHMANNTNMGWISDITLTPSTGD